MKRRLDILTVLHVLALALLAGLYLGAGAIPLSQVVYGPPRITRTPSNTPGPSPTPLGVTPPPVTFTRQPPQDTPTPLPPTATPTPTVPITGTNLIANGDFVAGFEGWQQENNYWRIHDITGSSCDANNPDWPDFMAEADRDRCSTCNTWPPPPASDRLWQDVSTPPHSVVSFSYAQAHHMRDGFAEVRIYGSENGALWEEVHYIPEPEAAWGSGHFCETPPTFVHQFAGAWAYYRVEFDVTLLTEDDGVLYGNVELKVW